MTLAESLDQKAKTLSAELKRTEADLLNLLIEMKRSRSFAELGFTGVYSYCEGALKLSSAQSHYFQKVIEKVEEVPALKTAIDTGKITLSQARRIVPVLTPANQTDWIEKAASMKQKDLEQAVTVANPESRLPIEKIRPLTPECSELKLIVTVEEEKEIRRVQDLLSKKLRKPVGLKEAIVSLAKDFLRKQDPVARAEKLITPKIIATRPQPEGRQPFRKPLLHEVNLRDRGRCTFVAQDGRRCDETRWTELHHKMPVSLGGTNTASNLTTLCSHHHRYLHTLSRPLSPNLLRR